MTKPVSRTDRYEALLDRVADLRTRATLARTAARAYDDIADQIEAEPSRSIVGDQVQRDVIRYARERAAAAQAASSSYDDTARGLEHEGIR